MKLPLITVPNKLLRKKSLSVKELNKENVQFISNLVETLVKKQNPGGVGLSAVQVGNLSRVFVTNLPPIHDLDNFDDSMPAPEIKVFINPEIVDVSEKLTLGSDPKHPALEGCLSIPSLYGPVPRHTKLKIKYLTPASFIEPKNNGDRKFEMVEIQEEFSNFYARVIQHEFDHLEGVLFTDYTLETNQDLYFDQNDRLVEIPEPHKLIQW